MPRTKSAEKALRQNIRGRERNLKRKKETQTVIKRFKKLIVSGKKEEAQKYLPEVYKKLDKMAKVNFIKAGKANRLKARLTRKLK